MRSKKLFKKGGSIENVLLQCDLTFNKNSKITITNKNIEASKIATKPEYSKLFDAIFDLLPVSGNTEKINKFLLDISKSPYSNILDKIKISEVDYKTIVTELTKLTEANKKAKNNGTPIYKLYYTPSGEITVKQNSTVAGEKEIIDYIKANEEDENNYLILINKINTDNIFDDITTIINKYDEERVANSYKINNDKINFQSNEFIFSDISTNNKGELIKVENKYKDIFGKYQIYIKEDERKFVTIDPSIIQIMIFDEDFKNFRDNDIVYSLKLIKRQNEKKITLRYTTQLFPNESKIENFTDLSKFGVYNKTLGNADITRIYDNQLVMFLKKYIKFYNFYRKCYTFEEQCPPKAEKTLIEYQLKYISILGKARFGDPIIQVRTAAVTDYIMANLLFASPSYAFISGGYKGFKDKKYGVTRSGYEIAKRYNRPILTIMCKEGEFDAHLYSDATLIYGEHWGEDSIALSQLTDGAIIIAPFGGWTYIECLTLLANKKIVGIYNNFFNILNYDSNIQNVNNENSNFFKFTLTEQNNIINYNINYYLILLYLLTTDTETENNYKYVDKKYVNLIECLILGIKILSYLKTLLKDAKNTYANIISLEEKIQKLNESDNKIETIDKISALNAEINTRKNRFPEDNKHLILLINNFKLLKEIIDENVSKELVSINVLYTNYINTIATTNRQAVNHEKYQYQNNIPEKCDGIWIKPLFDLISDCISNVNKVERVSKGGKRLHKKGGTCELDKTMDENLSKAILEININYQKLKEHVIFTNLNNNIIFVFSDVMYLNIYLNKNLNTPSFQIKIQDKINELLEFTGEGTQKNKLREIINDEQQYEVILDRNIDGLLDEKNRTIIDDVKLRKEYTFKINNDCNNYTKLITGPQVSLPLSPPTQKTKEVLINEFLSLEEKENILIAPPSEANRYLLVRHNTMPTSGKVDKGLNAKLVKSFSEQRLLSQ
jgi:hypothetical protein